MCMTMHAMGMKRVWSWWEHEGMEETSKSWVWANQVQTSALNACISKHQGKESKHVKRGLAPHPQESTKPRGGPPHKMRILKISLSLSSLHFWIYGAPHALSLGLLGGKATWHASPPSLQGKGPNPQGFKLHSLRVDWTRLKLIIPNLSFSLDLLHYGAPLLQGGFVCFSMHN